MAQRKARRRWGNLTIKTHKQSNRSRAPQKAKLPVRGFPGPQKCLEAPLSSMSSLTRETRRYATRAYRVQNLGQLVVTPKSWLAPLPCKMPKTDIRSKLRCNMAQQLGHGHRSFKGSLVRCISITFPCWLGEMNTACRTCFPSYAVSSASRQQPCFYHCQMLAMGFLGRRNHASPKSLCHSYVQSCHCLVCRDFALNLNGTSWA